MRISKELARSIALKLTEKSKLKADACKNEYGQLVYDIYDSTVPQEVKDMYKKHPDYFEIRGYVKFNGHGFKYEEVKVPLPVISNNTRYSQCDLKLTAAIADKLMKEKRKYEKAVKDYKDLFNETETALIALRTFKQIEQNIPAAKPFLPPPMSNALVCNFDKLNSRIDNQPEIVKGAVVAK
jgi:hypothetical protein